MPKMAQKMDKLAVIRSMHTSEVDHPGGIYLMHTGYRPSANVRFPEIGAIVAKYQGRDGVGPAELRQDLLARQRRRGLPRPEVSAVRALARRAPADVLDFVALDPESELRSGTNCELSSRISYAATTNSETGRMHREAYEARAGCKALADVFKIDDEWTKYRTSTATARSAGAA
jgi:hypothetical protein